MSRNSPAACIQLGRYSYFGFECNLPFPVKVVVGNYTSISAHVTFMGDASQHAHPADKYLATTFPFREKCGVAGFPTGIPDDKVDPIHVGSDCHIGYGVSVVRTCTIGDGAIVGARAVVAKDIPPYAIVVGNPARIIKYRYDDDTIHNLLRIRWWDWDHEKILKNIDLLRNVHDLVDTWTAGKV